MTSKEDYEKCWCNKLGEINCPIHGPSICPNCGRKTVAANSGRQCIGCNNRVEFCVCTRC